MSRSVILQFANLPWDWLVDTWNSLSHWFSKNLKVDENMWRAGQQGKEITLWWWPQPTINAWVYSRTKTNACFIFITRIIKWNLQTGNAYHAFCCPGKPNTSTILSALYLTVTPNTLIITGHDLPLGIWKEAIADFDRVRKTKLGPINQNSDVATC